jgi:hypothetical protein
MHFSLSLSVSFHQCFKIIFNLIISLSEGQAGETWEIADRAMRCVQEGGHASGSIPVQYV